MVGIFSTQFLKANFIYLMAFFLQILPLCTVRVIIQERVKMTQVQYLKRTKIMMYVRNISHWTMKIKQDRIRSRQDAIFKLPIKSVITRLSVSYQLLMTLTVPSQTKCSVER